VQPIGVTMDEHWRCGRVNRKGTNVAISDVRVAPRYRRLREQL